MSNTVIQIRKPRGLLSYDVVDVHYNFMSSDRAIQSLAGPLWLDLTHLNVLQEMPYYPLLILHKLKQKISTW
jgi:hypothetical protein